MPRREFSLEPQADAAQRWDLPARGAMAFAGVMTAVVGGYLLIQEPSILLSSTVTTAVALVLTIVGIGVLLYAMALRGGARSVSIGEDGLTLTYGRGRPTEIRWGGPATEIVIQDCRKPLSQVPHYLERRTGILWISPGPVSDLTPEVMAAVVNQAACAGLSVSEVVKDASGLRSVRVIRILSQGFH